MRIFARKTRGVANKIPFGILEKHYKLKVRKPKLEDNIKKVG